MHVFSTGERLLGGHGGTFAGSGDMCVDRLRDRAPESYTIAEERLNLLIADDATADWAGQTRPPSSPVVAELKAKDIRGGVRRRCAEAADVVGRCRANHLLVPARTIDGGPSITSTGAHDRNEDEGWRFWCKRRGLGQANVASLSGPPAG